MDRSNRGDPAWFTALSFVGLGVLLAGILVAVYIYTGTVKPPLTPAEQIEQSMLNDPRDGKLAQTIKAMFPEEFNQLKAIVLEANLRGEGVDQIHAASTLFVNSAIRRHLFQAAHAPHEALSRYRNTELALVQRLQAVSIPDCAAYFTSTPNQAPADERAAALQVALQIDFWNAAAAGRDAPDSRDIEHGSAIDDTAYGKAIRDDGISTEDFRILGMHQMPVSPPETQCRIGVHLIHAINQLPSDTADRVYGRMLFANS
jgi:hypothetical protein